MVQRGHSFAIVDEVDSILIDEARTPLIISGKGEESTALYQQVDQFVAGLKCQRIAETDDKTLEDEESDADYIVEEKGKHVTLTPEGVAKAEAYFHIDNLSDAENTTLNHHINQAITRPRHHEAGRGLCGQGRSGHHRGRVYRPPDVRPPL